MRPSRFTRFDQVLSSKSSARHLRSPRAENPAREKRGSNCFLPIVSHANRGAISVGSQCVLGIVVCDGFSGFGERESFAVLALIPDAGPVNRVGRAVLRLP